MKTTFIAYQSDRLTIEWYFDENGHSQAQEYYWELDSKVRNKLIRLFILFELTGKIYDITKFRYEGDNIFVFKIEQERFFCFFADGLKLILTNAYRKKSQKVSKNHKYNAVKAMKSYMKRCYEGVYYDKKS